MWVNNNNSYNFETVPGISSVLVRTIPEGKPVSRILGKATWRVG